MEAWKGNLEAALEHGLKGKGGITVLTGAGVSAESGIPTFRGPEGYWRVGSVNYQPHEISTYTMLQEQPLEVWKWFLYRRGVCRAAEPNPGHLAIVRMEALLGERFRLVTQNVDGLHLRAGNSLERTYQVHGNLNYMRCFTCSGSVKPVPESIGPKERGEDLSPDEIDALKCPGCGAMTRPHVLLWDEIYNEEFYRFESSLKTGADTALLIIVGTAGATNLPNQLVAQVFHNQGTIIDINIEKNRFSETALRSPHGLFCEGASAAILPEIVDKIAVLTKA